MNNNPNEIRERFEFLYFGKDRHLFADPKVLNHPIETLKELGGMEQIAICERGLNLFPQSHCSETFSFMIKVFEFPGHSIKAYLTRESNPNPTMHPPPHQLTRIRLGNYDVSDDFTRQVSEKLSSIPRSD